MKDIKLKKISPKKYTSHITEEAKQEAFPKLRNLIIQLIEAFQTQKSIDYVFDNDKNRKEHYLKQIDIAEESIENIKKVNNFETLNFVYYCMQQNYGEGLAKALSFLAGACSKEMLSFDEDVSKRIREEYFKNDTI